MGAKKNSSAKANGLQPLYTLGHSILDIEHFVVLLKGHDVELVVDVRSTPQRARMPHFSSPAFEKLLQAEHVDYLLHHDSSFKLPALVRGGPAS